MFKNLILALTVAFLGNLATLQAQNKAPATDPKAPTDIPQKNRFWQANVGGGEYMVALDRISAISRHKYVLDGSLIVDEVTVDALGQALVRFYFITPITDGMTGSAAGKAASRLVDRARDIAEHGADTVGTDIHNMVVKKFPETTHAKEIEFRVMSESELTGLYSSVRTAWETGRGRKFAIK
jgi:hypothetical protein